MRRDQCAILVLVDSMTRREKVFMWTGVAIVLAAFVWVTRLGVTWFLVVAGLGLLLAMVSGISEFERKRLKDGRVYVVETFVVWFFVFGVMIALWLTDNPRLGYIGMAGVVILGIGLKKLRQHR